MIIRRIAEHIRKQDWFVVFIEIMVVVIGIFIGLQVDDWNEQRKDAQLEREYLQRMQAEFERLLEVEQGRLRFNEARIAQAKIVEDVLDHQHLPEDQVADFEWGLYLLGRVNRPRLSWGTVEELRSTGNVQLIRDLSLRQALTDMENDFRWRDKLLEVATTIAGQYQIEIYKSFLIVESPHEGEGSRLVLDYDINALSSDQPLRSMISFVAEYQRSADELMRNNLSQLQALRDQIAEIRMTRFGDAQ